MTTLVLWVVGIFVALLLAMAVFFGAVSASGFHLPF
jgi:hypothetical protein